MKNGAPYAQIRALLALITRKFSTFRRLGFLPVLRCRTDRLWLGILRWIFKFDRWHAIDTFSCRPYKQMVVDLVDALLPTTVVEVGCGLGEILCRIHATSRVGIDIDLGAIRAARFLHPRGLQWIHGDCSAIERAPRISRIDCLIMVNWIHGLSPEQLAALLLPLLPRVEHLLLDAIDADGPPGYQYKHDFGFLSDFAVRVSTTRSLDEPRSFQIFKVTNNPRRDI